MDDLGVVLMLAAIVGFFVALVGLAKPMFFKTRKNAALSLGGAVVAFIAGGMLLDTSGATNSNAATPALTTVAATKPVAEPKVDLTVESKAVWDKLIATTRDCDEASGEVGKVDGSDAYEAYSTVNTAKTQCEQAWSDLSDLKPPPSAKGEAKKAFSEAIERCRTAYFAKSQAYASFLKVIDGDTRPSAVNEAKEAGEASQMMVLACAAGFLSAGSQAGVPLETFSSDKAAAKKG